MRSRTLLACFGLLMMAAASSSSFGASMRAELTPEEHALYMQQTHGQKWRSLNISQRCARMQQVRAEWRSMNPTAQNQLKQQLAARWQALPNAEKQRIEQRIAAHRERRAENTGARRGGRCAGAHGSAL